MLFLAPVTTAQVVPTDGDNGLVQEFARPGRATMIVNVWGSARSPGLWRVERDVDLVDFLSVIGIPGVGDRQPGVRTRTYVAIYRSVNAQRRNVYRERVEAILEDGAQYPALQENDILAIEVEERNRIGLQLVSSIVGTASSITLLVLRLTNP